MIIDDKMKSRTFKIIAIIFLILLVGCYTIIYTPIATKEKKFSSYPSMIDTSLIGVWRTKRIVMDVTYTEYQFIEFTKNRHIYYKEYYGDRLHGNLSGEYRLVYDTLYVLFNRRELETYLYKINVNNSALYLEHKADQQNGFTLDGGYWHKYIANYQEN